MRYLLVNSRRGVIVIEEQEFQRSHNASDWTPYQTYRAMTKKEAMEGMGNLGLQYKCASVGRYKSEYYDVTEAQAVLVKLFMQ